MWGAAIPFSWCKRLCGVIHSLNAKSCNVWVWSGADACQFCRHRKMLQNDILVIVAAKIVYPKFCWTKSRPPSPDPWPSQPFSPGQLSSSDGLVRPAACAVEALLVADRAPADERGISSKEREKEAKFTSWHFQYFWISVPSYIEADVCNHIRYWICNMLTRLSRFTHSCTAPNLTLLLFWKSSSNSQRF